jgi:hypothetical protein
LIGRNNTDVGCCWNTSGGEKKTDVARSKEREKAVKHWNQTDVARSKERKSGQALKPALGWFQ